ncbi:site-specific DNA-methyltransferase [Klebsiella phage vB_KpnM_IME346]|uniref:Site-specific DNA-methyltransferase n=1 Tax=Klebsiella phage vB_KpnM_IME346 TaxID=2562174 RepID=A0A4D6DRY1_9CAUD|nr:site-specific DNA-methyltransferase [Klebsiella phage vB_KpnM_IME346]QBZ68964.1 site-specific DNA-methyltransferase [Klebsiella phage vB_KpnM_IME346]
MDIKTENTWLMFGDCLERMKEIPDGSVDLILCDLPYGTTACAWDSVIPFSSLWEHYSRIISTNGAIVLTGSQPFTSALVMSNPLWFKYSWVWEKNRASGHVHAKNKPMKKHEDVCVFSPGNTLHASQSKRRMTYNPQGLIKLTKPVTRSRNDAGDDAVMSKRHSHKSTSQTHGGYPTSIINFDIPMNESRFHPTQKPVTLMEYMVRTYSNEGDLVLDNCMGSGTTGVACKNTNRKFIGIEMDLTYYGTACGRIL